jgi:hypothetical protein
MNYIKPLARTVGNNAEGMLKVYRKFTLSHYTKMTAYYTNPEPVSLPVYCRSAAWLLLVAVINKVAEPSQYRAAAGRSRE